MKDVFELIKQDKFSKQDIREMITFCKIEGSLAPLYAISFIDSKQEIDKEDILSWARIVEKHPNLVNGGK